MAKLALINREAKRRATVKNSRKSADFRHLTDPATDDARTRRGQFRRFPALPPRLRNCRSPAAAGTFRAASRATRSVRSRCAARFPA
jgi:hypothetical protein